MIPVLILFAFIAPQALRAQVSNYTFAQSPGTYTEITGGTVLATATSNATYAESIDDVIFNVALLPFSYTYNGVGYTALNVSTNGFITLGATAPGTTSYTPISGATGYAGAISAWGRDINGFFNIAGRTAEIRWETVGTTPNREIVFQWKNFRPNSSSSATEVGFFNFQIRLVETTNQIKIVYGASGMAASTTNITSAAEVGLRGASGDYNNRTNPVTVSIDASTAGGTAGAVQNYSSVAALPGAHGLGKTYTWTPPPACVIPTSLAATATATPASISSISGSFTAAPVAPSGYLVVRTTTNVAPVPADGTSYTVGTNAIGYIESVGAVPASWTSTALTPNTQYYYWVFSYNNTVCSGGPKYSATAATATATTPACAFPPGTYTVGATGNLPSLTSAVLNLTSCMQAGAYVFELLSDYSPASETYPITFPNLALSSATNTVTIRPAAGSTASITSANTAGTLRLDGMDYLILDGRPGGIGTPKTLVVENTSTSGYAIQFINDATNNLVQHATLRSTNTGTTSGTVFFSTTTGTVGNDNNTITNSDIKDGATLPTNAIYSVGSTTTAATNNSNNTVSNTNIYNFFSAANASNGMSIGTGNTDWSITGNHFYQTANRTATSGSTHSAITISAGNNHTVSNNFIGGATANAGGAAWTVNGAFANRFIGINAAVGSTTASNIQGNTIANFNWSSTSGIATTFGVWGAIYTSAGSVNITGNTIGATTGIGSIAVSSSTSGALSTGIVSASSNTVDISTNTVGAINIIGSSATVSHSFNAISNTGGATSIVINNNTVGSTSTANSINASTAATGSGAQVINGIINSGAATAIAITNNTVANINNAYVPTAANTASLLRGIVSSSGVNTITGNTVRNLSTAANGSGSGATASVIGISQTSTTAGQTVSQNTVYALNNSNATNAVAVLGINYGGGTSGTNLVARNFVYGLSAVSSSATAEIRGINVTAGLTTFQNNIVDLGIDALGAPLTAGIVLNGIYDGAGTNNFYHNTVYVGGAGVAGTANTHAFRSEVTTNTRAFQNNIFNNSRANGTGTGKHYAIRLAGTAVNPTGLTSNYNLYQSNGTGGVFGYFNGADVASLAAWQTAVGKDANSIVGDPCFVSPAAATPNLHLTDCAGVGNPANATGTLISSILTDFDGETRSTLSPVDIGADAGNFGATGIDLAAGTLITPILSGCRTNAEVVSVSITNNSISPIDFATNNATVTVTTTGGYTSSIVLNSGILAGNGASQTVTVPATLDMTVNGIYTFNANVSVVGDVNAGNNNMFPVNRTALSLGGPYTVGVGGNFTTLTAAVTAYNTATCITGPIIFNLTDASYSTGETFPISINFQPLGSAINTLTIKPNAGVSSLLVGANATSLVSFNGAKYVTIDGSNDGSASKNLVIRNKSVAPTVLFINDATNEVVKNTIVEGINTSTTSGVITFSTSTGTTGNSNNIISGCNISQRADSTIVPANAIYSSGSAAAPNANNTITGCNIFNFTAMGINVTGTGVGDNWTISNNNIYQTTARTTALTGISVLGSRNGHTINGNNIGGTDVNAGGSHLATSTSFTGIAANVGTVTASTIQGNTIKNIRSTTTAFTANYGIYLLAGTANIANNTVGSANVAERIEANGDNYGYRIVSSSTVIFNNNILNNMTTAPVAPTGQYYFGVSVEGAGAHTITNNTITNFTNTSAPDLLGEYDTQTIGILIQATGVQTIRGNTVSNIGTISTVANTSTLYTNRVWGVILSGTAVNSVFDKNRIENIYGSAPAVGTRSDVVTALQLQTTANATVSNNMINTTGGNTSDRSIYGILDISGGAINYYFNTVNIGGTATTANNTYAFNRNSTTAVNLKNNIFTNERTGGTGFKVAMANTNASAAGWSVTASDYNVVHNADSTHVTQWLGAAAGNNKTLSGFKTITSGDAHSKNRLPVYTSATDLHLPYIVANASFINAGVAIAGITTDIDNQTRSSLPDIGADEFGDGPAVPPTPTQDPATPSCTGGSALSVAGTPPAGIQWYWQTNATDTSFANPVSGPYVVYVNGTYYVRAYDPVFMLWSASASITVTNIPVAPLPPSPVADQSPACLTTNITVPPSGSPSVTYYWQGTTINGTSNTQDASTPYVVTASGTYYVAAFDATSNCWSNTNGVAVVIETQVPAAPTVTPAAPILCVGNGIALNAAVNALSTASGIGTATTSGGVTTSLLGPNPFQTFYGGTKQQMLFTAAELTAMGIQPNVGITSMAIEMASVTATNLGGLSVKMGHTSVTALSTWITGLNTVRPAQTHTPTVGYNTLTFSTPFVWNGTSNVVVEINYSNNNGGGTSPYNTATYSTTTNVSTLFYRVDNQTPTTLDQYTGTPSFTYTSRNNVKFSPSVPAGYTFTWTPTTSLYTDNTAATPITNPTNGVYAKPTATTPYTVSSHLGTCSSTPTTVTVTVNPLPVVDAGATQTVCPGASVTLSGSGASTYTWNNGVTNSVAFTASNTTTLYTVTGTDVNGCINTDTVSVIALPTTPLSISPAGPIVTCQNEPVTLTANGPVAGPANPFIRWNFNASNLTPSLGTGTALLIGGTTETFASGSGSTDPVQPGQGWNTTSYPNNTTPNPRTAGAQFNVSTVGYENIVFTYDVRHSGSAANRYAVQYTPDATNGLIPWTTVEVINYNVNNTFQPELIDLSTFPGTSNNPALGIRIVSDTASNGQYVGTTAAYGTSGTVRYDMVTFTGNPIVATYLWNTGATTQSIVPTVSGTYVVTVTETGVCSGKDSVAVTINPVNTTILNPVICSGESYTLVDGDVVNTTGIYTKDTLSVITGCDSVIVVNLTVNPVYNTSVPTVTICNNETYELADGTEVNTANTYVTTVPSINGCDSTVTVQVFVIPAQSVTVNTSICADEDYTLPNGTVVTAAGSYTNVFPSINGCDSTIITVLTVKPIFTSTQNPVICSGQTQTMPDGTQQGVAGTYTFPYTSAVNGCDSTITVNLTVNPIYTTNVTVNLCPGDDYTLVDNTVVSTNGVFTAVTDSYNGCDSTVIVTVILRPVYNTAVNAAICQGGSYTLVNGAIVTTAGIHTAATQSVYGCDSLVVVTLAVNSISSTPVAASICQGDTYALPNGTSVSTQGVYTTVLQSSAGCDSTIVTTLTVNPTPNLNLGNDIVVPNAPVTLDAGLGFASYLWNTGATTTTLQVTQNGTYSVTVTNQFGCEATDEVQVNFTSSIVTLGDNGGTITLFPNPTTDRFTLNVKGYTGAGDIKIDLINAVGQVVKTEFVSNATESFMKEMDVTTLATGTYTLRVKGNNGEANLRVVIAR